MNTKCLFLGHTKKNNKLIKLLEKKGCKVKILSNKIKIHDIKGFHLFISFGYRHLISEKILKKLKRPIINLHMSYLPYNRGAHPNYWSFIDNTPKGISIIEIDKGIDTGPVIYQKKIKFNLKKNKNLTFEDTYNKLIREMEKLFITKVDKIISGKYLKKKQERKGTFHNKKDLPKELKNWKMKINNFTNKFNTKYSFVKVNDFKNSKLIYSINAEKSSRQFSIQNKIFSFKEHTDWMKKLLKTKEEVIYLVKKRSTIIGILRTKKLNNNLYLSWVIKVTYRGRGYGKEMLKQFIKKNYNKKYFAKILNKNFYSIKMARYSGFRKIKNLKKFSTYSN